MSVTPHFLSGYRRAIEGVKRPRVARPAIDEIEWFTPVALQDSLDKAKHVEAGSSGRDSDGDSLDGLDVHGCAHGDAPLVDVDYCLVIGQRLRLSGSGSTTSDNR